MYGFQGPSIEQTVDMIMSNGDEITDAYILDKNLIERSLRIKTTVNTKVRVFVINIDRIVSWTVSDSLPNSE